MIVTVVNLQQVEGLQAMPEFVFSAVNCVMGRLVAVLKGELMPVTELHSLL